MRRHIVKPEPPSPQIGLFDGGALPPARPRVITLPQLVTVERLTVRKVLADYRREHIIAESGEGDRARRFSYIVPKFEKILGGDRLVETLERKDGRTYAEARLAEWARGTASAPQERSHEPSNSSLGDTSSSPPSPAAAGTITESQVADLKALCESTGIPVARVLEKADVQALEQIAADDYPGAVRWVQREAARPSVARSAPST